VGASRSNAIVDDEALLERLRQLLAHHARHDVGIAAGSERHDDRHGPGRPIGLRLRDAGHQYGGEGEPSQQAPRIPDASMDHGDRQILHVETSGYRGTNLA
jgi:hypothetical protein